MYIALYPDPVEPTIYVSRETRRSANNDTRVNTQNLRQFGQVLKGARRNTRQLNVGMQRKLPVVKRSSGAGNTITLEKLHKLARNHSPTCVSAHYSTH